ncbi:MAG: electron transfer flavoprotein subunit alpha/FixB family protein [Peptococcaceae bacterium]
MSKDIWVYVEHDRNKIENVSLELLGEAIRLQGQMADPGKVAAVIIGSQIAEIKKTAADYGAEVIYAVEDERLSQYSPEYYGKTLEVMISQEKPYIFLMGATYLGTQLAPMVAAKIKTGVAAHCVELKIADRDNLVAVVPAFGGKVLGDILCPRHLPQMATVKPGILAKPRPVNGTAEIIDLSPDFLEDMQPKLKLTNICKEEPQGMPLEEAEIVVCGGWGIGDRDNWLILEKIARRLGGALACTRPPIDEGWASGEQMMIGTSGKSVRPKIYLGFGISGATHHVCGMKDAGLIITMNKDEGAEIFKVSDYGLVGDVKEVLPLLAESLGI